MTAHKHAALMLQYAQDAMETDKPWERWWISTGGGWRHCVGHPCWNEAYEYHRKPRTMTYTVTIPEPLRVAPGYGQTFFIAAPNSGAYYDEIPWEGDDLDVRWLKRGLCFATAEDAIAAAKAMLPVKGEE